jgi:GNAT superfamily N-acetyltransferase
MSDSENIHVRVAGPQDYEGIMRLGRMVWHENGVFGLNEEKAANSLLPLLFKDGGIVGVIGPSDNPEAAVVLRIANYWYADESFLEEVCVFVHPNFRSAKGGRARHLVEFAKRVADDIGMPLMIGVLSNTRTEAKMRLYERQFGKPSGVYFLYNAKTGQDHISPPMS